MFRIFLNSRDRTSGSGNTDWSILLNDAGKSYSVSSSYSIAVESVILPNLEYNINEYNNKLYILENGSTSYELTLPIQNYTADQLRLQLQTLLNDASALTYTVSYNDSTKKLTFTTLLPNVFQIKDGSNSISNIIGFTGDSPTGAGVVSTYPINIAGTEYVDLEIGLPNNNNIHSGKKSQVFARIPIDQPFGYFINYLNPDSEQSIRFTEDLIFNMRIRFLRPDGRLYKISENSDISIVLKCQPYF